MEEAVSRKPNLIDKFRDPSFRVSAKGKWYAIAPLVIVIAGLIVFLVGGFNLGLDFTGGRIINVNGVTNESEARATLNNILSELRNNNAHFSITTVGDGDVVTLAVEFQNIQGRTDTQMAELTDRIVADIQAQIPGVTVTNEGEISARTGSERLMNTFIAVIVALLAMLVYMLFRFRFTSGVSAVIGLIHDVLVMLALTAIFRVQLNQAFIAALITVIGYSINNTLILFDRVRSIQKTNENNRYTAEEVVDRAVKETFVRTMNTTVTTLVPIFVLIVAPIPALRQFALPVFFGLIAGTFSTIFVTTALYVRFENAKKAARRRKQLREKGLIAKSEAKV